MRGRLITLAGAALIVLGMGGGRALADSDTPPYKDPSLPFDKRVADLLSRMTLQEKAQQTQHAVGENTRLGIPAVNWWTEALHGLSNRGGGRTTVFPQAIGMAA